jgi:hypothetical protein
MMFFGALAFTIGAYATFSNRLWIAGTIMAALALFLAFVGISWHRLGRVRPARRKFVGRITPKSDRHRRS